MSDEPNRRPIATRSWALFHRIAAWLADLGVTPNAISLSSIAFGVMAGAALTATAWVDAPITVRGLWLLGAAMIQLRLIANLLDGLVAVEGGKRTPTGELYNEAPDRIADTAVLVGAGYAVGGSPWWGAAAAIVALFVAYLRALGASAGVGQAFLGPMAKQHRMAVVTALAIYLAFTPTGWQPTDQSGRGLMTAGLIVIAAGGLVTSARRLRFIAQRLCEGAEP